MEIINSGLSFYYQNRNIIDTVIKCIALASTLIFGSIKAFGVVRQYFDKKRAEKAASAQDEDLRLSWYSGSDFSEAASDYLEPMCSNIDPSDNVDLRLTVSVREKIFSVLDRELNASGKKYILILADSGMGKTTLLLNYFLREQKKSKSNRRRIAIAPLGAAGALDRVSKITDKRNTILFLDALDEDPRAIENFGSRFLEIMNVIAEFEGVLLTCRTQFFPNDNAIPQTTGIRRVSARRADQAVEHQWRTVYIEPFDNSQIEKYIKSAIPWYRFEHRSKSKKILSSISDLAARPMLTSLVPGLAASNRDVNGLWDLYGFMVDKWIERESSWVKPEVLRKISKSVAFDIIINRTIRGAERITRPEFLALTALEDIAVDFSMLSARSLLNRDADGQFKFAHRSILEFFFIQAFVDGKKDCIDVKWTDMMCDLFISWGHSNSPYLDLGLNLLDLDYSKTGLFPIAERHEPSSVLDENWVKRVFSPTAGMVVSPKVPNEWRNSLAHIKFDEQQLRAYDVADGLVWQLSVTNKIMPREERSIFLCDRYHTKGIDIKGREWNLVNLHELRLLCNILASKNCIDECIDDRELYWLSDNDGASVALARIRFDINEKPVDYHNLKLLGSFNSVVYSGTYGMDIYIGSVRDHAIGSIEAHAILASHGKLDEIYHDDFNCEHNWSISRSKIKNLNARS